MQPKNPIEGEIIWAADQLMATCAIDVVATTNNWVTLKR
jgi:hypothetical protein